MIRDPLDEALELEPIPYDPPVIVIPEKGTEAEFVRENIARMLGKMEHSIDQLMDVARISQHPQAYEKLANFTKIFVDANHELLKIKKTDRETTAVNDGPQTVNNNLIMTTEEVLRLLKDKK